MKRAVWIGIILIALLIPVSAQAADEVIMTPVPIGLPAEEPVGVWVGGVDVSAGEYWVNDGSGSITHEGATQENYNVFYDSENMTLYLRDAKIQMEGTEYLKGISLVGQEGTMTIQLQGHNEIFLFIPEQEEIIETHVWKGEEIQIHHERYGETTYGVYADFSGDLVVLGSGRLDISLCSAYAAYGFFHERGNQNLQEVTVSMTNEVSDANSVMFWTSVLNMDGAEVSGESFSYGFGSRGWQKIQLKSSRLLTRNVKKPLFWEEIKVRWPDQATIRLEDSELYIEGAEGGLRTGDLESRDSSIFIQARQNGIETLQSLRLYGGNVVIGAGNHALSAIGELVIGEGAQVNVYGGDSGVYADGSITLEMGSLQAEGGQYAVRVKQQENGYEVQEPAEYEGLLLSEECLRQAGLKRQKDEWDYLRQHWERHIWLVDAEGNTCKRVALQQDKEWKIDITPETTIWEEAGMAVAFFLALGGLLALTGIRVERRKKQ